MSKDYQIRHPRNSNEVGAVFDMLQRCFPRVNRVYFLKRILGDISYARRNTYILTKENKLISHVHLFRQKIHYYGDKLSVVGLGAICTFPEYRNKGYCLKLLKKVIHNLRKEKVCLLTLLTKIPDFYKKLGFIGIEKERYLLKPKKKKPVELSSKKIKVRRFNFEKDILSVMDIYGDYFKDYFGPAVRGFRDWIMQFSHFNEDKRLFLVIEEGQEIKAYIRCKVINQPPGKVIDIVEYASKENNSSYLTLLLSHVSRIANINCLRVDKKIVKNSFSKFSNSRIKRDSLIMYKLLNKKLLFSKTGMQEFSFLEADTF